jgi:hypothetical protein
MKTNKTTHAPVYSLGAENALEVVEQAFCSVSSVQARRNDEGMDMLANDLKRAHEVLKEERAELLDALRLAQSMLENASIYGGASETIHAAIAKAEGVSK